MIVTGGENVQRSFIRAKGAITGTQSETDPTEAAAEQVAGLSEKPSPRGKKASEAYPSSYEKAVVLLPDQYEKTTGATKIDWLANISSLQADATREMTRAYTSAVREFVS